MSRTNARCLLFALIFCLPTSGLSAAEPQSDVTSEGGSLSTPPNVLMICIDDLNDWTGFLGGHPDVLTPHMDDLARRGCSFTNAHCAVPVCSASRVSIMSGVAATTHGSYELGPRYEELPALKDVPTMHRHFKRHGYSTFSGGKVLHHGFRGRLAGDIDQSLGQMKSPKPSGPMNRPANWHQAWDWGAFPQSDAEMGDYRVAKNAVATLREGCDKPFFMSVGFFRPHVPLFVPPKWFDQYEANAFALPGTSVGDIKGFPNHFLRLNRSLAAPTHAEVMKHGKQRSLTHAYLASITFVDHCVGIVLDGLKESQHADNTFVVLWSDHGFHLGEKQHWAKRTLWEESTRVPLVIAGPGIASGNQCREPASLLDVYPTLVDLCRLPENPHLEGVSLVPQLNDPTAPRKQPAITSSYFGNHSIRSRDWRLTVYRDGAEELYDQRKDPDELRNLANDANYKVERDQLARWLPKEAAPEHKKKSEWRDH